MKRNNVTVALAAAMALATISAPAAAGRLPDRAAQAPGLPVISVQGCGWYVILGCSTRHADAVALRDELGGPYAGGGAGLNVVHTDDYPNFRDGYFCVADGPYGSSGEAGSIAWTEAVPDAYVKDAC
ncbi:hypothetical protein FQ775_13270 [Nitratireductor mangrovi]|uniref:Secreted protein n=1 Tax=Nitratireductor mangrovi TaxID=2599600 RepID=A0A5B8L0A4_9HYPH|nr:hypothetical protein [Nitratireductor mangrovi]QDZ01273.1 hypothetical protein FQ775_13270 [Nitratireductor mangrovi]